MGFKIRFKHTGFTSMEMLLVVVIIMILVTISIVSINAVERQKKGRDARRLSDLSTLERILTEFYLDNGIYPDTQDVTRHSNEIPSVRVLAVYNIEYGWIDADLREYDVRLPVDPVNDSEYFYSYRHDDNTFELNAKMEKTEAEMQSDGGNDPLLYEIGTNLLLISP